MRRIASFLMLVMTATAQSTGELTGTVTDSTGAALPQAQLKLTSDATSVTLESRPNEAGLYRFTALTPGLYTLTASSSGFAQTKLRGIAIEVNRVTRADATLTLATTEQTVEVSATGQLLDLETGTKGYTIVISQMRDLPLQTRNPLALMTLTPGVFVGTATAGASTTQRQASDGTIASSGYSINGGARTATGGFQEYIVDGISITNQRDGGATALPSADALQEFRVQSGGMSSEFGRTIGGVVNYVTASGTSALHGNLFASNRNTATTARRAIPAVGAKPINNFNQFGGTVSGPVRLPGVRRGLDNTFFFFGYEGSRWLRNNPTSDAVPTVRMRNGDFGEVAQRIYDPASNAAAAQRTPFANNAIPASRINQFGKKILDLYPQPSRDGVAANYIGRFRVLTPVDNYTGRVDRQLTPSQRLMGRVTWVESINNMGWNLGDNDFRTGVSDLPSRNLTFNYNFTIRPNLLYTAAFGYTRFHRTFVDPTGNTAGAGFFGFAVEPKPALQQQNVRALATFDLYRGVGNNAVEDQLAKSYQLNQSVSYIAGKHTLRFGADIRKFAAGGLLTVGAPNGSFGFSPLQTSQGTAQTGHSAASAILGLPNTATFSQPPRLAVSKYSPAFFVQDDFRVLPNLTVNLGLRLDREGGLVDAGNKIGYFDADAIHPAVNRPGIFRYAGLNGAPNAVTKSNGLVSPRVGFAWSPKASKRTAIRGALGFYNSPVPTDGYFGAAVGFEPTLDFVRASATDPAVVLRDRYTLPAASGPLGDAAYLGQTISQPFNREPKLAQVYQWNFGFQHEVMRNLVAEVLYTGNRGSRLIASRSLSQLPRATIDQAIALTGSTNSATVAQTFLNERVNNPLAGRVPGTLGAAQVTRSQAVRDFAHFAGVSAWLNDRDSIYHALQATLQKRLSEKMNFMLSYALGKAINNTLSQQDPYNTRDARGAAAIDRTHSFSAHFTRRLPFGFQWNGILQAYSGTPVGVTQSGGNGLGVGAARPDVVGDTVALSEQIRGVPLANGNVNWLDRAAYSIVNGRYGNAPASDSRLRAPGFWQLDLGVMRDFKIREPLIVRFRAEAFNAFNHTNLATVDTNLNSPTFGQVSGVSDPRIFQFGLEVRF